MIRATVNENTYTLEDGKIDGQAIQMDEWIKDEHSRHIIFKNVSYRVTILDKDLANNTVTLRIGNDELTVSLEDRYDQLLSKLGMDNLASAKENTVKAPMPGMILKVMVTEGQSVSEGDDLLILEAMKMENVLTAPSDGLVQNIAVKEGEAVEKNALLIDIAPAE